MSPIALLPVAMVQRDVTDLANLGFSEHFHTQKPVKT